MSAACLLRALRRGHIQHRVIGSGIHSGMTAGNFEINFRLVATTEVPFQPGPRYNTPTPLPKHWRTMKR